MCNIGVRGIITLQHVPFQFVLDLDGCIGCYQVTLQCYSVHSRPHVGASLFALECVRFALDSVDRIGCKVGA
jgi:succinate dehydrogenase/fumarate reductase-like Fe-S protein